MDQFVDDSDLSGILLNAPGNPVIWDKFLSHLVKLTVCDTSCILMTSLIHRENTRFLFSFNIDEKTQSLYNNQLNRKDGFNYLLSKHPKQVFYNQDCKTTESAILINNAQLQFRMGFSIPCNTRHTLNLCVSRKSAISNQQQHEIKQLFLSIISPLETAIKKEQQKKIYSQVLHHVHGNIDGFIIVDPSLNILFSDHTFPSAIAHSNCLEIADNQIKFAIPDVQQQLLLLIKKNKIALINSQCAICQMSLIPISALDNLYYWECYQDSFILTVTHDTQHNPVIDRLVNIHKLSKSEAACALEFMQTPSIIKIAEQGYRSQSTIRNHIKHIMRKMDVHNQAALMKKLLTLASL
ncbi:MAG: hypothetical protein KAT04_07640 [Methylococcales bacterium]|nr:hypothetical protein [Methylococcales bacterium]